MPTQQLELERRRLLAVQQPASSDSESDADDPTATPRPQYLPAAAAAQCRAITALWFAKGCADAIPTVALRQFILLELSATPATQAVLYGVVYAIPWNFKFGAAFISDTLPIYGRRRIPYMVMGVLGEGLCWTALCVLPSSIELTAAVMFGQRVSSLFKLVMLDTLTVEAMNRYEQGEQKGRLQSNTWLWGGIGGMLGNLAGGLGLSYWPHFAFKEMFSFRVGLIAIELLIMSQIDDPKTPREKKCTDHTRSQAQTIWETMHEARVWRPMVFVCVFHCFPNNSDAFNSFLLGDPQQWNRTAAADWPAGVAPLHFSSSQFGYVNFMSMVGSIVGIYLYKTYFHLAPWRPLFALTILFSSMISLTQLLLISGWSSRMGIPAIAFALGDDLVAEMAGGFMSMPLWVLMGQIVPAGAEGSVFALVTSLRAMGTGVSGTLSAILTAALGVSLDDFSNLWWLTAITGLARLLAIPFVLLVPLNILDAKTRTSRSRGGALALLIGLVGGTLWAVATALYRLTGNNF